MTNDIDYKIDVMTAFKNGERIEWRAHPQQPEAWTKCLYPTWDWHHFNYRIAKPEPKKVKLLAWLVEGDWIQWRVEGSLPPSTHPDEFKRIPELDKEITLP